MEETKKCPYCGEEILAVAKKCKHCKQWLTDDYIGNNAKENGVTEKAKTPESKRENDVIVSDEQSNLLEESSDNKNIKLGAGIGIVVLILLVAFAFYYGNKKYSQKEEELPIELSQLQKQSQSSKDNDNSDNYEQVELVEEIDEGSGLKDLFVQNVGQSPYDVGLFDNSDFRRRFSNLMEEAGMREWDSHRKTAGLICPYDNKGKYGVSVLDKDDQYNYYIIYDTVKDNLTILLFQNSLDNEHGSFRQEKPDQNLINNFTDSPFYQ